MPANRTPLALFTYNRPKHTDQTLTALARCERLDECDLRIYCDGPKRPEHEDAVAATREVVARWAERLGARVTARDENLGLARSIVGGVTELCNEAGRVIVLEDDLLVSPDFIDYMLQALGRYADEPRVYQVSGYMFPVEHACKPDAFLLPLTSTWGWATWARAWSAFDWDAADSQARLADPAARRRFDLGGAFPYADMLAARLDARNDSWGILWHYAVFKADGLVLHPRQTLAWNAGIDGTGVHCGVSAAFPQAPRETMATRRLPAPIAFPVDVAIDEATLDRVAACLRTLAPTPPLTLLDRVKAKVKRILGCAVAGAEE